MSKPTIIIQAHLDSSRLPKKVIKKIVKKPMIWHVIQRVKRVKKINKIILAISDKKSDNILCKIAKENKIEFFCGDKKDVLDRYFKCAQKFNADPIIRITSDCPLMDSKIIEEFLNYYLKHDYDYVSNTMKPTYPDGLDIEIFSFKTLEKAALNAKLKSEREHVTPYIKNNPKKFRIHNMLNSVDLSEHRWTVDEKEDLIFIRKIFNIMKPKINFSTKEILKILEKDPKLIKINQKIKRDEGYLNSVKNDKIIK